MKTETRLKPNFKHRLSGLDEEATPLNLSDSIHTLALQADSMLALISDQFVNDEEEPVKMSDEIMYWSIESVRQTVKDMRTIVDAYHQANRTEEHRRAAGESATA
ncbi:hypothetical protein [Methylobacter sp.]|uniref:hypothetical protein n=1 Tax=Methylobacter sp. TaxID=2051955 RepID=UPI003DA52C96